MYIAWYEQNCDILLYKFTENKEKRGGKKREKKKMKLKKKMKRDMKNKWILITVVEAHARGITVFYKEVHP